MEIQSETKSGRTTVEVKDETLRKIKERKIHPRQSSDEIINEALKNSEEDK